MQIIDDTNSGGRLGAALGTGLHQLAQNKLNMLTQRYEDQKNQSLEHQLINSNVPPVLARLIVSNPKLAQELVPDLARGGIFNQQEYQQPMQEQSNVQQQAALQEATSDAKTSRNQQISPLDMINLLNTSGAGGLTLPQQQRQPQAQALTPEQQVAIGTRPEAKIEQPRRPSISEALSAKEKATLRKEESEKLKQSQKEQHYIDKETQPYFDQVLTAEKAANDTDRRAGRLDKIVKEGGLPIAFFYDLFKKLENASVTEGAKAGAALGGGAGAVIGIPGGPLASGAGALAGGTAGAGIGAGIGAVAGTLGSVFRALQKQTSPNLEEFEKLSSDFIKGAKAIFGARITDKDLEYFFNTIPTLSQTDAGKKKILRNIKTLTEASHLEYKTMKEIIKENGGKRPGNLALLVQERMQPDLDILSQKFISGD